MKRLSILVFFIPLLFTGCTRDPYADFIVSKNTVNVGEVHILYQPLNGCPFL